MSFLTIKFSSVNKLLIEMNEYPDTVSERLVFEESQLRCSIPSILTRCQCDDDLSKEAQRERERGRTTIVATASLCTLADYSNTPTIMRMDLTEG